MVRWYQLLQTHSHRGHGQCIFCEWINDLQKKQTICHHVFIKWLFQGENSINQVSLTVVQKAILEATKSVGKFRVNWDSAESPNIIYPITAAPEYNTVTIAKLHPNYIHVNEK